MIFTDAHSGSAGLHADARRDPDGRYSWRSRLQAGVLGGFSPPLIDRDRLTVPALLRQHGYRTACIGKWHLGMTMPAKAADQASPTTSRTSRRRSSTWPLRSPTARPRAGSTNTSASAGR